MKISASLYSSKNRSLPQLVKELDDCYIDYFHIDCNDDPGVFKDIAAIREYSHTPIDLHIISEQPEQYLPLIEKHQIEYVTFQLESLPDAFELPVMEATSFGLALVNHTPIEKFIRYRDRCDFVLFMTTTPGMSGGKFHKDTFKRIRKFRNTFPGKGIHVDGGVNDETGFILRILGVEAVVSGSYLVNHPSIGAALMHLRSSVVHSDYQVKDFMMDLEDAPVLPEKEATVRSVFQAIDTYNMGFTLIVDEMGTLTGISSNADMRKGILKHLDDFNKIELKDIINKTPVTIQDRATITELLQLIHSKNFLISYLPVMDDQQKLVGALSFINLIRSES